MKVLQIPLKSLGLTKFNQDTGGELEENTAWLQQYIMYVCLKYWPRECHNSVQWEVFFDNVVFEVSTTRIEEQQHDIMYAINIHWPNYL